MSNQNQTQETYSFRINPIAIPAGRMTAAAAVPGPVPLAGPEIGPDPRNSQASIRLGDHPQWSMENGVLFDFNHGFRVEMPPGDGEYLLRVIDLDAQNILMEMELSGGRFVVGDRKYYIRYGIEVIDRKTNAKIARHAFDCAGKNVMIVIPDGGLGDNLAWLPFAEAFCEQHRARVTVACGEWLIRLVRDQYPDLNFVPVASKPSVDGFYAAYFCAVFPKDRKNWRPADHQNFGMQGSIAKILGLEPAYRKVRLALNAPRPFPEPFVVISAMATNPAKYWNYPGGWNILCRYLKRLGYRVLVIDRDASLTFAGKTYSIPSEAENFTGWKPLRERIALLQHAEFFIGLPSGLSWLAWNCNVPVVMLAGFTLEGSEFPTPYRVTNFNFCHGCWNDSECFFDMKVPVWCPRHLGTPREIECTRAITPKMVIDTVNRIPRVRKRIRPMVSFAVPVCDPEIPKLTAMLESVIRAAEEYGNAEFLLQDDASENPDVPAILRLYRSGHPGLISLERSETRRGLFASRQRLVDRCRGKYMIPFDHDDVMLPFDLAGTVRDLEDHPDTVASYSKKYFYDRNGLEAIPDGYPYSPFLASFSMMQIQNAAVLRLSAVRECGAYTGKPCELDSFKDDVTLFSRLAFHGPCHFSPEGRTLAWRHNQTRPGESNCDYERHVRSLIAPYAEDLARLLAGEATVLPNDRKLCLLGAEFFLTQNDKDRSNEILRLAMSVDPRDPGLRRVILMRQALFMSEADFLSVWNDALRDFPGDAGLFVIALAYPVIRKRGFLSPEFAKTYSERIAEFTRIPGSAFRAYQALAPVPNVFARTIPPVRVSVLLAAFRAEYLRPCVESIVRTFAPYGQTELLLYNDASPDPSLDILLSELEAENPDMVRVFRGHENIGVASARQYLLERSKGDYIVSFDHDDLMLPFDVARVVKYMDENPGAAVSYASKYLFTQEKGYIQQIHGSAYSHFALLFAPKVNINAAFIRRRNLLDAHGFLRVNNDKTSGFDDVYLFTRLGLKADIHFDPVPRTLYRVHPKQITADAPLWDSWITRQACAEYPELYRRIEHGDIPDTHGPDFRAVRAMMGAAVFLHQTEPAVTLPVLEAAIREFPDDPGIPDVYLTLLRMYGRFDAILDYYPRALKLFENNLFVSTMILNNLFQAFRMKKLPFPEELLHAYKEVTSRYLALPPFVAGWIPPPVITRS